MAKRTNNPTLWKPHREQLIEVGNRTSLAGVFVCGSTGAAGQFWTVFGVCGISRLTYKSIFKLLLASWRFRAADDFAEVRPSFGQSSSRISAFQDRVPTSCLGAFHSFRQAFLRAFHPDHQEDRPLSCLLTRGCHLSAGAYRRLLLRT